MEVYGIEFYVDNSELGFLGKLNVEMLPPPPPAGQRQKLWAGKAVRSYGRSGQPSAHASQKFSPVAVRVDPLQHQLEVVVVELCAAAAAAAAQGTRGVFRGGQGRTPGLLVQGQKGQRDRKDVTRKNQRKGRKVRHDVRKPGGRERGIA